MKDSNAQMIGRLSQMSDSKSRLQSHPADGFYTSFLGIRPWITSLFLLANRTSFKYNLSQNVPAFAVLPAAAAVNVWEGLVLLNIFWGNSKDYIYGPTWFKYNYETVWFTDALVQEMLLDIDRSTYLGGELIRSDILGPIPPERLSGGVKTLISIYKRPDLHFDATSCGPNCAKWLLEIGNRTDVTAELGYIMSFEGLDPFRIRIVNSDRIVTETAQLTYEALPYM